MIDLGSTVKIKPTTHRLFTYPICQALEGLFGLPWITKVDLWALDTLAGGDHDHW